MAARKFGDRYDGRKIRNADPLFLMIPVIMRNRNDSQVFFDESIDISKLEQFIYSHRQDDLPNLRILHVVMAALVRSLSQRPQLNRFIAGKKIYARNYIRISLAVKRKLTVDGDETTIMPEFDPNDSLYDVYEKFNTVFRQDVIDAGQSEGNSTDVVAKAIGSCPTFIKSFAVGTARLLDNHGCLPKFINRLSPFHSSIFLTDLGSLGIGPVYHHLYEFGTCSIFVAMGKKETIYSIDENGNPGKRRQIRFRIVLDERICDGHYSSLAIKYFKRCLQNPECLLTPPDTVIEDM